MQGIKRNLLYVALYEGLAILISSLSLRLLVAHSLAQSTAIALTTSLIAISWNLLYNRLFESWEARCVGGRPLWVRALHSAGFELGLLLLLLPLFAWSFQVSLAQSLVLQLGMVVFFLVYNFVFTLGFDRVFGLPESALVRSSS